jgi:hypothetical protein
VLRARKVVYIRAVRAGAVDDAPAFKLSVCSNYLISVVGFFYADNLCIQLYFGAVCHRSVGVCYAQLIGRHNARARRIKRVYNLIGNIRLHFKNSLAVDKLNKHPVILRLMRKLFKLIKLIVPCNDNGAALEMRNVQILRVLPHQLVSAHVKTRL